MKTCTVPTKSRHNALSSLLALIAAIPFLFFIAACTTSTTRVDVIDPTNDSRKASGTPNDGAAVVPPDPALAPPAELIEQPLTGSAQDAPEVWLVPSLQSKQDLATHIGVELVHLNWVNPGLPEPVLPGTLIVVPPGAMAQYISPISPLTTTAIETRLAVSPSITVIPAGGRK